MGSNPSGVATVADIDASVLLISHDRAFLRKIATRIVELDRGRLLSYPGNFTRYQALKEEQLAQESVINAKADKLLAQEEVWLRRGVKARRTRDEVCVALDEMLLLALATGNYRGVGASQGVQDSGMLEDAEAALSVLEENAQSAAPVLVGREVAAGNRVQPQCRQQRCRREQE